MTSAKVFVCSVSAIALILAAHAAQAQTAPSGGLGGAASTTPATTASPASVTQPSQSPSQIGSPASQTSTLGEVVVTARRRAEDLQKVPVAITAFSQQSLTERQITNGQSLSSSVPGLNVSSDSGRSTRPLFAIRGVGQEFGAAAGSVETYFAEVPLSGPFQMPALPAQYFDLSSLQVLKGPQGTLFGRSTTGGAVLFVPQAPTDQFGGYLRVQGGDYNDFQAEGAINIPLLGDKADLRLSGFDWQRSGYGHTIAGNTDLFGNVLPSQTYDNQDVKQFRATLKVHPIENLQNTTIFVYNRDNNRDASRATVLDPTSQLGGGISFLYPNLLKLSPYTADISTNLDHQANRSWAVINTTTYNITQGLTLKNIFGHIDAKGDTDVANDVDGSPLAAIDLPAVSRVSETYQTTDELQLQGHMFGDRLSWIFGGLIDDTSQPGGDDIGVIISVENANPGVTLDWQQNSFLDYGAYGSLTYKLTDKLSFTAGERHSWDDIHVLEYTAPLTVAQFEADNLQNQARISGVPAGLLFQEDHHVNYQGDTYDAGLEYQATNATLIYGGYKRGFKQGGFNVSAPVTEPAEQSFTPENDDDFYLGVKTRFNLYGMPGRFNLEGYWDIYHNKQQSYLTLTGSGNDVSLSTVTYNVPKSTYRGLDADITLDITHWLRVDANYSYIDAYYNDFPDETYAATAAAPACAPAGCTNYHLNLAVNPVAFVSPNKVAVTPRFHTDLANDRGELVLAPTISYQDRFYTIGDAYLLPQGETAYLGLPYNYNSAANGGDFVRGYMLIDLRAEWNHVWGSPISAAFNISNLTNRVYSLGDTTSLAFGVQSDAFGPPRMFTFELSAKF